AGDHADRKSTSGVIWSINDQAVACASKKKQYVVAISTIKSEFIAGAHEVLGVKVTPSLMIDNQSALKSIENDMVLASTTHITLRYHYMKDEVVKTKVEPI
ncbi:TPA: hypothetical protein N0F65_009907, partial [Lagenidium giganteum]